jgi:hypothetical protein
VARRAVTALACAAGIAAAAMSSPPAMSAQPSAAPCDWVTADEAAGILGGPVSTRMPRDDPGSIEMSCGYSRGPGEDGVESELRLPGDPPRDAASQFALATSAAGATVVHDVGVKAVCVVEPMTTPPSTTLVVLLSGDRIYRATGWYHMPCDALKRFAQLAIGRIGG